MKRSVGVPCALLAGLAISVAGCEPGSITAANQQLARGPANVFALAVPINADTLLLGKYLNKADTTTTTSGLLGLQIPAESLASAIGQKLQFSSLTLAPFNFSYAQMLTAAPDSSNLTTAFAQALPATPPPASLTVKSDTLRFRTPAGSQVYSASVSTGSVYMQIRNVTRCGATIADTVKDSTGAAVVGIPATVVAAGANVTDTVSVAGKTFTGYLALALPSITPGGACAFSTPDSVVIVLKTSTLTMASVTLKNVNEGFTQSYSALAGQTDILAVDTVVATSGSFSLTVQNRLPLAVRDSVTLNGVTVNGLPLKSVLNVPAAPGTGATTSGTLNFNLAGAVIRPAAVQAVVTGSVAAATATLTPTVTTNAVVVTGTGSMVIQSVSGSLNPATTPELVVPVQEFEEVPASTVDFGDLKDAVMGAKINDASAVLAIRNTAQTPVTLSAFTLGLVRLDNTGQPVKDGLGNVIYEKDSTTNQPILVNVVQPGLTTLLLPRASTTSVTLQMAPLVNRLVHLILSGVRTSVVAAGTASAGDGTKSRITRADSAAVKFTMTVGIALTVPDSGVVFTRTQVSKGAGLKPADSTNVVQRLVEAGATAVVTNGVPLGVQVSIAVAADSLPTTDVFTVPGHITFGPITAAGAPVDSTGRSTGTTASTDSLAITTAQLPVLLGKQITTTVKIRLLPPAPGKPSAVRVTDRVLVNTHADLQVRSGGGQ